MRGRGGGAVGLGGGGFGGVCGAAKSAVRVLWWPLKGVVWGLLWGVVVSLLRNEYSSSMAVIGSNFEVETAIVNVSLAKKKKKNEKLRT